jgi:hypothetical protein
LVVSMLLERGEQPFINFTLPPLLVAPGLSQIDIIYWIFLYKLLFAMQPHQTFQTAHALGAKRHRRFLFCGTPSCTLCPRRRP